MYFVDDPDAGEGGGIITPVRRLLPIDFSDPVDTIQPVQWSATASSVPPTAGEDDIGGGLAKVLRFFTPAPATPTPLQLDQSGIPPDRRFGWKLVNGQWVLDGSATANPIVQTLSPVVTTMAQDQMYYDANGGVWIVRGGAKYPTPDWATVEAHGGASAVKPYAGSGIDSIPSRSWGEYTTVPAALATVGTTPTIVQTGTATLASLGGADGSVGKIALWAGLAYLAYKVLK